VARCRPRRLGEAPARWWLGRARDRRRRRLSPPSLQPFRGPLSGSEQTGAHLWWFLAHGARGAPLLVAVRAGSVPGRCRRRAQAARGGGLGRAREAGHWPRIVVSPPTHPIPGAGVRLGSRRPPGARWRRAGAPTPPAGCGARAARGATPRRVRLRLGRGGHPHSAAAALWAHGGRRAAAPSVRVPRWRLAGGGRTRLALWAVRARARAFLFGPVGAHSQRPLFSATSVQGASAVVALRVPPPIPWPPPTLGRPLARCHLTAAAISTAPLKHQRSAPLPRRSLVFGATL